MANFKQRYGINGADHKLGLEIKEAEFKGYVVRALEDITSDIREIKEQTSSNKKSSDDEHTELNKKIFELEKGKVQLDTTSHILIVAVPIIVTLILKFGFNL